LNNYNNDNFGNTNVPYLYANTITVSGASPVVSITFGNPSAGSVANFFAVSGNASGAQWTPIPVSGFNATSIVPAAIPYPITATVDSGTNLENAGNTWFEQGYDRGQPTYGLPPSGSSFSSISQPNITYQMGNYSNNCAILIDTNHMSATITPATPVAASALAFLTSGGNGGGVNTVIVEHADGVNETNSYTVYDWFNGSQPISWVSDGRIDMSTRTFQNLGGGATGDPRLFDELVILGHRSSPVTNIVLQYDTYGSGSDSCLLAISAAGADVLAPDITMQPSNSVVLGGSNISLSVSAIGFGPLTYQWYSGYPTGSGNLVAGATNSTLTFDNATSANSGTYYVVVTDANGLTTTSGTGPSGNPGALLNVITTPLPGNYFQSVVALNPLGYWPLNETAQPPAFQGYAVNIGTAGATDNALYDAVAFYQDTGALADTNPNDTNFSIVTTGGAISAQVNYNPTLSNKPPFTVEAWLNSGAPTVEAAALSCLDPNSPRSGWVLYMDADAAGVYNFRTFDKNGTAASDGTAGVDSSVAVSAGTWHYVVAVVNTNGNPTPNSSGVYPSNSITVDLYVDGVLTGTSATNGAAGDYAMNDSGPFSLGARGDSSFFFTGSLDEVAYYPVALSASTIAAHYAAGTSASPAQPYYKTVLASPEGAPFIFLQLDEAAPSYPGETSDPVANNYGATGANDIGYYLPGSAPGAVAGPAVAGFPTTNVAVAFNHTLLNVTAGGDSGFVDVPVDGFDTLNITGPITVAAWIKATPNDNRFQSFLGRSDNSYRMDVDNNMAVHFADAADGSGDVVGASPDGIVNDSAWHFVVGLWDGSEQKLYVDGLLNAEGSATGNGGTGSNDDFTIGVDPQYITSRGFDGDVSQVAVFDYALTDSQVLNLFYAAEVAPRITNQPPPVAVIGDSETEVISVGAYGTPTLTYQWLDGGAPVSGPEYSGATTPTLTINNAQPSDAGNYSLVVSNAFGSVTSSVTALNVSLVPIIIPALPPLTSVLNGTTLTLTVGEAGESPFTNAWYLNGVLLTNGGNISGATTTTLTISNAGQSAVGTFVFTVTNAFGGASDSGNVLVDSEPTFDNNAQGWMMNNNGIDAGQGAVVNNVLTLTDGAGNETTSFFNTNQFYIHAFKAGFTYQDVGANGSYNGSADGFTFIIQHNPEGASALEAGGGGSGLAYYGLTNSIELCAELYNNNKDITTNTTTEIGGINVATNGEGSQGVTAGPGFFFYGEPAPVSIISGDPIDFSIYYDGSNYSVTLTDTKTSDTFTTNYGVGPIWASDILNSDTAYVGFTAATGGAVSTQTIANFSFVPIIPITLTTNGTGGITLSWPTAVGGYALEESSTLLKGSWTVVPGPYTIVGNQYQYTVPTLTGIEFFQLVVTP
jgi:hypothetical protein